MSNTNVTKKKKKKNKKKKKLMLLQDYLENQKINLTKELNLPENYENHQNEENNKNSNYLFYKSNINSYEENNTSNITNKLINRKISDTEDNLFNSSQNLNLLINRQTSASTNNSSFDDDNKIINKEKDISRFTLNPINENYLSQLKDDNNNNYNSYKKENFNFFNNDKLDPKMKSNINTNINTFYNVNNNVNNNFYYFNNNINSNFNYNYYNNNFNKNIISSNNFVLVCKYNFYYSQLKKTQNNIKEVDEEIQILRNKTLHEMFISSQSADLYSYIQGKNALLMKKLITDNNKDSVNKEKKDDSENPEHPYFYTNHNEELQIKNVLYIIEGLFCEDNLKKDFNLMKMLNRDGYASLTQLEDHPQLVKCKISKTHLIRVFEEHRNNDVTETVETFDDILIRNKKWVKIKKEIKNIEKLEQTALISMKNKKDQNLIKFFDKKRNLLNYLRNLINQLRFIINYNIQQKLYSLQFNHAYNWNYLYNNRRFNMIYNSNSYKYIDNKL